jgi:hypothetical protein
MPEDEEHQARVLEDLEDATVQWRRAATEAERRRAMLIAAVEDAAVHDGISEYVLARTVGVQRLTIRAWLGKGRP